MKLHNYVKKNWDSLPKSKFDELEVVVVKENYHSEEGWGHHSYEGIAVNKDGKYLWVYSSGCSCNGGPSSNDADIKSLVLADGTEVDNLKPADIDFEALQVEFTTY